MQWVPDLSSLNPDVLIISPCGFDIDRTFKEIKLIQKILDREYNVNEAESFGGRAVRI